MYVDTSALLDRAFGQKNHAAIDLAMRRHITSHGTLVASRLLHLEAERVSVRESLRGATHVEVINQLARTVRSLPLTEQIWQQAHAIRAHVRTLDALHLATCAVVDAVLLCSDHQMLQAADSMGLRIHRL
jgi:predicted nucleic acid-binding protein